MMRAFDNRCHCGVERRSGSVTRDFRFVSAHRNVGALPMPIISKAAVVVLVEVDHHTITPNSHGSSRRRYRI